MKAGRNLCARTLALLLAAGASGGTSLGAQRAADSTLAASFGRRPQDIRGIAIDARMADDLSIGVGSRLGVSASPGAKPDTVVVAAIFEPLADPAEISRTAYRVRLHLDHLQSITSIDDRVDRFAVQVKRAETLGNFASNESIPVKGALVDSALARVNHVAFGFRAYRSSDIAAKSSRTFLVVERFHRAIGVITVVASAVFLLCLLLLTVEERRRQIAALRLMGISSATIVRGIVLEAALVSLLGSLIGVGIGWAASALVNWHYQEVYRTPLAFALVTPGIVAFAATLSLFLGTIAGGIAAWRLVRQKPLQLLGR